MNYAQLLFPDFSLIACGWLLCRYTPLDRRVWDQVESLVYYFLFPVLLFHSIVRSPLDFGATSNLLTAGVGVGLCGIALSYALPFLPGIGTQTPISTAIISRPSGPATRSASARQMKELKRNAICALAACSRRSMRGPMTGRKGRA